MLKGINNLQYIFYLKKPFNTIQKIELEIAQGYDYNKHKHGTCIQIIRV